VDNLDIIISQLENHNIEVETIRIDEITTKRFTLLLTQTFGQLNFMKNGDLL